MTLDPSHKCPCNCSTASTDGEETLLLPVLQDYALESKFYMDFRLWHVLFMGFASVMALVVCVCCCVRFRIPRTKQEIEADFVRKKITRKFKKQLHLIQNTEMDEMDLKRALERVRAEFKSDAESLAVSEAASSSSEPNQAQTGVRVSIEELMEQKRSGLGSKLASFVSILRPRRNQPVVQDGPTKMGV